MHPVHVRCRADYSHCTRDLCRIGDLAIALSLVRGMAFDHLRADGYELLTEGRASTSTWSAQPSTWPTW